MSVSKSHGLDPFLHALLSLSVLQVVLGFLLTPCILLGARCPVNHGPELEAF